MNKEALRRRYISLWTGEATAALFFTILLLWSMHHDGIWQCWIARTYSLSVVNIILIQAVIWWRWKVHLLNRDERSMPAQVLRQYQRWRAINWWLIGGFPFVVIFATSITGQSIDSLDTWLGLFILAGALLEHINYYYVQLMYNSAYDWKFLCTHRRPRLGTVAKALRKSGMV